MKLSLILFLRENSKTEFEKMIKNIIIENFHCMEDWEIKTLFLIAKRQELYLSNIIENKSEYARIIRNFQKRLIKLKWIEIFDNFNFEDIDYLLVSGACIIIKAKNTKSLMNEQEILKSSETIRIG